MSSKWLTSNTTILLWGLLTIGIASPLALCAQETGPIPHPTAHRPDVPGVNGLVTGGHPLASIVGARILMDGGNAIDATVAIGAVLNVVKPASSGAGGNGFFTIYHHESGEVVSMNATGAAPLALQIETMTSESLQEGIRAGIVPGTIGGWIAMLQRYGTKSLGEVLTPAITYAENGHPIDPSVARSIEGRRDFFAQWASSSENFLVDGRAPEGGEMVRFPALASTFRKLAEAEAVALEEGRSREEALQAAWDRFYRGDIAEEIDRFHRENGGLITLEDLTRHEPIWAEPIRTTYRGYEILSSPSTSRGGYEVVMGLNLLEGYDLASMDRFGSEVLHLIAEAIKVSKSDIYEYVADPNFTDIPVDGLVSKEFADGRRRLIQPDHAIAYPAAGTPPDWQAQSPVGLEGRVQLAEMTQGGSTDSYSVADRWGNVVGSTPTHGSGFGTGVVVGSTGLTFNNGMRLGSASPYPDNVNYPEPGKIPILNNAPTMVFRDGRFVAVFGTPGGEAIGQMQLQVAVNLIDFGMSMQEAVEAPRFRLSADPTFYREGATVTMLLENRVAPQVVAELRRKGHEVELVPGFSGGNMQGILKNLLTGTMKAGADPRNLGYAIGF